MAVHKVTKQNIEATRNNDERFLRELQLKGLKIVEMVGDGVWKRFQLFIFFQISFSFTPF